MVSSHFGEFPLASSSRLLSQPDDRKKFRGLSGRIATFYRPPESCAHSDSLYFSNDDLEFERFVDWAQLHLTQCELCMYTIPWNSTTKHFEYYNHIQFAMMKGFVVVVVVVATTATTMVLMKMMR